MVFKKGRKGKGGRRGRSSKSNIQKARVSGTLRIKVQKPKRSKPKKDSGMFFKDDFASE